MRLNSSGKLQSYLFAVVLLATSSIIEAADTYSSRHPDERDGTAIIIHKSEVIRDRSTNSSGPMRLWPLHSTPEARMNYVEVTGASGLHFHPDADHKLYVLEGHVIVIAGTNAITAVTGDLIIIPKGFAIAMTCRAKASEPSCSLSMLRLMIRRKLSISNLQNLPITRTSNLEAPNYL